jgi:hypothetical protein
MQPLIAGHCMSACSGLGGLTQHGRHKGAEGGSIKTVTALHCLLQPGGGMCFVDECIRWSTRCNTVHAQPQSSYLQPHLCLQLRALAALLECRVPNWP